MFSYLEDRKKIISTEIIQIKKELEEVNYTLREDERFLDLLECEKVVPFVEFTPQVVTKGEQKKQKDMREKIDALNTRRTDLSHELSERESEIKHIDETITLIMQTLLDGSKARETEQSDLLYKLKEIQGLVPTYPQKAMSLIGELITTLS